LGVLTLVVTGIVMTTVMQSSTAAITVTISALFAGAIGLDQALALVIGQNIGTSTSSAMAAIGASSTAKRLAVAYIAFKLIAAAVALVVFPVVVRLMVRAAESVDPVTLVAAYHTAYNVVGVVILLPLMGPFTRLVERIVPERGSVYTRYLDPAALAAAPIVAVEATRRTVAHVLEATSLSANGSVDVAMVGQAADALHQANAFLSKVTEPLVSEEEQRWLISTVHALDHAVGFVNTFRESERVEATLDSPAEGRAVKLYREAMRSTAEISASFEHEPEPSVAIAPAIGTLPADPSEIVAYLGRCATELAALRLEHRRTTLESVASGRLTASDAIARVEAVRLLDQRVHHVWRAAAHLAAAIA
jgi:phosphate:Na+ symporter